MMAEPSTLSDGIILQARHDTQAMAELYDVYYPRIFRYCRRRLFLHDTAEDITSNIFLRVARNIRRFSGTTQGDFEKWIFAIASNEANRHLRKHGNRQRLMDAAISAGRFDPKDATGHADDMLDWPTVYTEILKLRPSDQNLLVLRFFENCSTAQIADITKIAHGAVRTRLSRIIAKLRQTFQDKEVKK
jgi:RNA polymerase sigma-70 factor (ECF subfamily)